MEASIHSMYVKMNKYICTLICIRLCMRECIYIYIYIDGTQPPKNRLYITERERVGQTDVYPSVRSTNSHNSLNATAMRSKGWLFWQHATKYNTDLLQELLGDISWPGEQSELMVIREDGVQFGAQHFPLENIQNYHVS